MKTIKSPNAIFDGSFIKVTTLLFFFFCLFATKSVLAQDPGNFSGLKDKELAKNNDLAAAVSSLFGTKNLEGEVTNAKVIHDSERELTIELGYESFETAFLRAEILNASQQKQNEMNSIELDLTDQQSPLSLSFALNDDLAEGTAVDSEYLKIKVSKSKSSFGGKVYLFNLGKQWQTDISPENLVVNVDMEPIGSAAELKQNQSQIVLPRKAQKFQLAAATLHQPASATLTRATYDRGAAARVASATATPGGAVANNQLIGTWNNTDANTRGITKVLITNNGSKIQVFGKCHPKDCDWGTKSLTKVSNNSYKAVYTNVGRKELTISITNNKLTVYQKSTYTNNRPPRSYTYTFNRAALVLTPMIYYPLGLDEKDIDKGLQGPDNNPISLWESLMTDVDFESPESITNIRMEIYPDKNPESGAFYYVPSSYAIKYDEQEGHHFRMLHGTDEGPDDEGNVLMTGTLSHGIGTKEIEFIKDMLKAYVKDKPGMKFSELRPIPITETPALSFELGTIYNIPEDKISINVSNSLRDPVNVSWVTDITTKEEMLLSLKNNIDIKGTFALNTPEESLPQQSIPVGISLASKKTFSREDLDQKKLGKDEWLNRTPFPIKVKYVHMLIATKQGNKTIPIIYSWDLHDTEVPAAASLSLNTTNVPAWLTSSKDVKRVWMEYATIPCDDCNNQIIQKITAAIFERQVKRISFSTLNIFESTGAALLKVKIRSAQLDPQHEAITEGPTLIIDQDNQEVFSEPLYTEEGAGVDYEYTVTLVMPDGQAYEADQWTSNTEQEVYLGTYNLTQMISELPEMEP